MLSTSALALQWPPASTNKSFRCTYEGIFPQSTVSGTWEYVGDERSIAEYEIQLSDNAMITPLVRTRVADEQAVIQTLEMTQKTNVAGGSVRERTSVEATIDGPTIGQVTLKITSTNNQICSAATLLSVGDRWTCTHTTTDGWSVQDGNEVVDSGEEKHRSESSYRYVRDEPMAISVITDRRSDPVKRAEQTIQSAVVEETTPSGLTQRMYLDPDFVWCPLRIERIRWKRVVGTDRLIARHIGDSTQIEPVDIVTEVQEHDPPSDHRWSYWWLLFLLFPLLFIIFWIRRS